MKYTQEQIREKLETSQEWLERGIVAIYNYQTNDEKWDEETKYHNDVGFNGGDAKYMTYVAKWIKSGKHLSGGHVFVARKRMRKYAGQLARIANKVQ